EAYTLSLHDALPICGSACRFANEEYKSGAHYQSDCLDHHAAARDASANPVRQPAGDRHAARAGEMDEQRAGKSGAGKLKLEFLRSEEHTSELQSLAY